MNNHNNNQLDDDIPLPSMTQSTSVEVETDEEERRRILEGIFAEKSDEEEEEDEEDSDEDETIGVSAFMDVASGKQQQQRQSGGSSNSANAEIVATTNNDEAVNIKVAEALDRAAAMKQQQQQEQQQQQSSSGHAYLSSSSDEDEEVNDDNGGYIPNTPVGNSAITGSAFDQALNEVQQGRGSRSNSFTFNIVDDEQKDDEENMVGETTTEHSTQVQEEEVIEDANADDDFFAKAEHNVLDEIFSENPDADEEEEEEVNTSMASFSSGRGHNDAQQKGSTRGNSSSSNNARIKDRISLHTNTNNTKGTTSRSNSQSSSTSNAPLDVLSSMRQKIESFNIFDGDSKNKSSSTSGPPGGDYYPPSLSNPNNNTSHLRSRGGANNNASMLMMDNNKAINTNSTSTAPATLQKYYNSEEERETMRRAFQQSISAAVLVSLAHKRYERRRLAAMEIEKVVRSLVVQEDYSRVRAILLLLSDDYVRSTNEDARKGGAVALAACAIGLKKANEKRRDVIECRDLILASVVHACQDHSQRVRYYATESLFNVTKVIPSLAVQHFFILFEILRSLYADVDLDVRSGAELLDKKLKEVIVGAINSGSFSADACVPVFARFVYMRNKATKQLTLTWLKEFSEKLVGAPMLEFLHLFLGGIFQMVADPNGTSQLALEFLQSVLPKLLVTDEEAFEDAQRKVDFDKILQSLVLTLEHPDPFVRKVAMYWMSRIVQAHMSSAFPSNNDLNNHRDDTTKAGSELMKGERSLTAASISVRNALPHVLPGILLSIGDTHQSRAKDTFLPDQTTHSLAEQANTCLQDAVRRDGKAFIPHLGGFIVALREELDVPGGLLARNPPSVERRPYRMDVKADGSGIESTGWFRASDGVEERDNALILSRLCALQWAVVLYEHVVPNSLKADYTSEFIDCIIYQLVDQPPGIISECIDLTLFNFSTNYDVANSCSCLFAYL